MSLTTARVMTLAMEREVTVMCNLSKGVEEKGMAKGLAKGMMEGMAKGITEGMAKGMAQGMTEGMAKGMTNGILASIKNLVKNMGISVEQAMTVLEIPEAERPNYRELLQRQ